MAQDDDASGIVGVGNRDDREEVRVESTSASGDDVSPSPREEEGEAIQVTTVDRLHADGSKHHANVKGRFVTVFRLEGKFYCIDSVCYHAGGPLTLGDIEDVDGQACVRCPWHNYIVTIKTGEKLYQSLDKREDGKMVPGAWKSVGVRQRMHEVFERDGKVFVTLASQGDIESDRYATNAVCGARIHSGGLGSLRNARAPRFQPGRRFADNSMVGGDGRMP